MHIFLLSACDCRYGIWIFFRCFQQMCTANIAVFGTNKIITSVTRVYPFSSLFCRAYGTRKMVNFTGSLFLFIFKRCRYLVSFFTLSTSASFSCNNDCYIKLYYSVRACVTLSTNFAFVYIFDHVPTTRGLLLCNW